MSRSTPHHGSHRKCEISSPPLPEQARPGNGSRKNSTQRTAPNRTVHAKCREERQPSNSDACCRHSSTDHALTPLSAAAATLREHSPSPKGRALPRGERSLTNERGRSANQPPPRSIKRLGVPLERPKPQFASGISERTFTTSSAFCRLSAPLERPVRDVASTTASTKHPTDQTSRS